MASYRTESEGTQLDTGNRSSRNLQCPYPSFPCRGYRDLYLKSLTSDCSLSNFWFMTCSLHVSAYTSPIISWMLDTVECNQQNPAANKHRKYRRLREKTSASSHKTTRTVSVIPSVRRQASPNQYQIKFKVIETVTLRIASFWSKHNKWPTLPQPFVMFRGSHIWNGNVAYGRQNYGACVVGVRGAFARSLPVAGDRFRVVWRG